MRCKGDRRGESRVGEVGGADFRLYSGGLYFFVPSGGGIAWMWPVVWKQEWSPSLFLLNSASFLSFESISKSMVSPLKCLILPIPAEPSYCLPHLPWVTQSLPSDCTRISLVSFTDCVHERECCCCSWVASVVSDSVRPHGLQPTRLRRPWDSPGKNTGVGCHFLLQWTWILNKGEVPNALAPPLKSIFPLKSEIEKNIQYCCFYLTEHCRFC